MKGLVAVLAALCAQGVSAQWGPWTQWWSAGLGAWQGDTAAFAVAESDWLLLDAPAAGTYEVLVSWQPHENRGRAVPVLVETTAGRASVRTGTPSRSSPGSPNSRGAPAPSA